MTSSSAPSDAKPLKALVIGAGIAGLTAALGLRRQGHQVQIFERSALLKEYGAAIAVGPNASAVLSRLGLFLEKEEFGGVTYTGFRLFEDDDLVEEKDQRSYLSQFKHPYRSVLRQDLHRGLVKLTTSPEGQGSPATLLKSCKVVNVDVEAAKITLEDGRSFSGDVVVGADGIHSLSRNRIPGAEELKERPFGMNAYRCLIPREVMLQGDLTRQYAELDGYTSIWRHAKPVKYLIMYPCAGGKTINFASSHRGRTLNADDDRRTNEITDEMRNELGVYSKGLNAVIDKLDPETVGVWEFNDMDKIPAIMSGKLAVIGDAAHPFLPFLGQGGAMAMEDAASIAALLPLGTRPEEVTERLKLYSQARYDRAHFVQQRTRDQVKSKDIRDNNPIFGDGDEFATWLYDHDAWEESEKLLVRA